MEKDAECIFYACEKTMNEKNEVLFIKSDGACDEETKWLLDSGCTNHMTNGSCLKVKSKT